MSLIRQVWILIMGTIVLASAGSVLMSVWTARGSLETQLSMKNNDNAQTLALSLSQQRGDAALLPEPGAALQSWAWQAWGQPPASNDAGSATRRRR